MPAAILSASLTFTPGTRIGDDRALAPDGKRVPVATPVEAAGAPARDNEVVCLLNFFDELRRRGPGDEMRR